MFRIIKGILSFLLIGCLFVAGCSSEPINYETRTKEATIVNMTMSTNGHGVTKYSLIVEDTEGKRFQVMTDATIFHQITFGSRVRLTYDSFGGWAAIAILP